VTAFKCSDNGDTAFDLCLKHRQGWILEACIKLVKQAFITHPRAVLG